jgi:hypothetical protein
VSTDERIEKYKGASLHISITNTAFIETLRKRKKDKENP